MVGHHRFLVAVVALCSSVGASSATIVTVTFAGKVTESSFGAIPVGASFSGSAAYNLSASPVLVPGQDRVDYFNPPFFCLNVFGNTFTSAPGNGGHFDRVLSATDDAPIGLFGLIDALGWLASGPGITISGPITPAVVNLENAGGTRLFAINFSTADLAMVQNFRLPSQFPPLSTFQGVPDSYANAVFDVFDPSFSAFSIFDGPITSIQVSVVNTPEPGSWVFAASGAVIITLRRLAGQNRHY